MIINQELKENIKWVVKLLIQYYGIKYTMEAYVYVNKVIDAL